METDHLHFVGSSITSFDVTKSVMQLHFNSYMLALSLKFTIHILINTNFSVETMNSTQGKGDFLLKTMRTCLVSLECEKYFILLKRIHLLFSQESIGLLN